ncbi:PAS domain-containing sensor histidine kinase [Ferruginibacter sp. HRS2-29]|uniref:sensor histidine kinase n=1 Tax=Ferruginibacter sp. HRS2-29 TaxID=2487334 RepID=UPI0020CFB62A|nr:PAS domain-containing sensor histidine kinase [Ferruginibacter sp. HRS2-29]MCP9753149.1 PAS domain S-box protein [Ferruginibacter sp. HRS2-29]
MDETSAIALVKEKERFQALFEHASLGILVADENGAIELVNNFMLRQFGYTEKNELVGKPVETLIPQRYNHSHHRHRENYNRHPEPRSMGVGRDLYAVKKDGSEFPVEVSLSNYHTIDGNYIIAFVIDITKRKEIEQDVLDQQKLLKESSEQIEQMNIELEKKVTLRTSQLEEAMHQVEAARDELEKALEKEKELGDLKSRFVSMASHEFRTPLSTVLSSASLLAKYTETDEQDKRDKHINRIKASVNNLTSILNEFLSIGKIEDGKVTANYTNFNVREFIENVCTEVKAVAKEGQQIMVEHAGKDEVMLDESLLRNIMYNLLSNAIKFSGPVAFIHVSSRVDDEGFTIRISDNGIGISEEDQQHLFERFFRASNVTNIQGTGLGLHIVARYVELMGGNISFESELEKGTSFTVSFKPLQ